MQAKKTRERTLPTEAEKAKVQEEWVRHEDFPEGHPFQYYSRPQAFSFGGLMGSGAIA